MGAARGPSGDFTKGAVYGWPGGVAWEWKPAHSSVPLCYVHIWVQRAPGGRGGEVRRLDGTGLNRQSIVAPVRAWTWLACCAAFIATQACRDGTLFAVARILSACTILVRITPGGNCREAVLSRLLRMNLPHAFLARWQALRAGCA